MTTNHDLGLLEMTESDDSNIGSGCGLCLLFIGGIIVGTLGVFLGSRSTPLYLLWIILAVGSVVCLVLSFLWTRKSVIELSNKANRSTKARGVLVSGSNVLVSDCVITWEERVGDKSERRLIKQIEEVPSVTLRRSHSDKHDIIVSARLDDNQLVESLKLSLDKIALVDGKDELWSLSFEKCSSFYVFSKGVATTLNPKLDRHHGHIVKVIRVIGEALAQSGCKNVNLHLLFFAQKGGVFLPSVAFGLLGAAYVGYSNWRSNQKLKTLIETAGPSLLDPETGETLAAVLDRLGIEAQVVP